MTPEELKRQLMEAGFDVIRTYRAMEGDLRAVLCINGEDVRFTVKSPSESPVKGYALVPMP